MSGVTKAAQDRNEGIAAAFLIEVITGMRAEEVAALTWNDLEQRLIHVAPLLRRTWRAMRLFFNNDELAALLRQMLPD